MACAYNLREIVERATSDAYSNTTLAKVISLLSLSSGAGVWLGGGAIRRTLLNEEPDSDFDIFVRDANVFISYTDALRDKGFKLKTHNEQCSTYVGELVGKERVVQVIRFKDYAGPVAVLGSFDYTICQFVTDGETLWTGDYSLWDLGRKRLVVNKITYPVASMRRLIKYTKQGFFACDGTLRDLLLSGRDESLDINTNYVD